MSEVVTSAIVRERDRHRFRDGCCGGQRQRIGGCPSELASERVVRSRNYRLKVSLSLVERRLAACDCSCSDVGDKITVNITLSDLCPYVVLIDLESVSQGAFS